MFKNIVNRFKLNQKSKRMSVQSIIIGSVIAGVIAAGGLAMLWPSVSNRKFNTFISTIKEVDNTILSNNGAIRVNNINYRNGMNQMPKELEWSVWTIDQHGNANGLLIIMRDYENQKEVDYLKSLAVKTNDYFDNDTVSNNYDYHRGKVRFNTTCSNYENCFIMLNNVKGGGKLSTYDGFNLTGHLGLVDYFSSGNRTLYELIKEDKRGIVSNGALTYTFSSLKN